MRAGIVGSHVVLDAQFVSTDPTKDSLLVKFSLGPNLVFMVCFLLMTGKAGVILVATFELDRDDVQVRVPMHTSGLVVHRLAKDIDSSDLGYFQGFQDFFLSQDFFHGKKEKAQKADKFEFHIPKIKKANRFGRFASLRSSIHRDDFLHSTASQHRATEKRVFDFLFGTQPHATRSVFVHRAVLMV